MCITYLFVKIYILYVTLSSISCKKYDIEAECVKLYGEKLQAVLLRFRKTPDYSRILTSRVEELKSQALDVGMQTLKHHAQVLLNEKIEKIFEEKRHEGASTQQHSFRADVNEIEEHTADPLAHYHRRQAEPARNKTPETILDEYAASHQKLKVEDVNEARQLGYEQAGLAIKAIIKNMGGCETGSISTRVVWTTTEGPSPRSTERPATAGLYLRTRTEVDKVSPSTAFRFKL